MILLKDDIKAAIEALLFASGEKWNLARLSTLTAISEAELEQLIQEMVLEYAAPNRGIQMVRDDEGYFLCTKPHYGEILGKAVRAVPRRLSGAALETLAIVAYRQPVSKIEIERIRGVKSDHIIARLLEKGLIEEAGYAKLPGKPLLYATSFEFLKLFGISSLDDLPDLEYLADLGDKTNGQESIG